MRRASRCRTGPSCGCGKCEAILARQQLPLARHNGLWEPVREHARMLGAFEQDDPDGAAYLMQLHIVRAAERIGICLQA